MTHHADIPSGETLTVEFKSDLDKLQDAALIEIVVCLANASGGSVFLGVEDDGTVTGLHRSRRSSTGLPAMIANRTSPRVHVSVEEIRHEAHRVV